MRKKSGQRSTVSQPAPAKGTASSPPLRRWDTVLLAARWTVAVALIAGCLFSVRFVWRMLEADVISQRAFRRQENPSLRMAVTSELRRAHRLAPFEPVTRQRLAGIMLQTQSQRLVSSGYQAVNFQELVEALELLREARKAHHSPQVVVLRAGQCAGILSEYSRQAGDAERARRYASISANHYLEFRNLQGRPTLEPRRYYRAAAEYSFADNRPQLALLHIDDYTYYFGEDAIDDPALRSLAMNSRYLMGEFHLMMHDVAALLWRDAGDPATLGRLETFARRNGQRRAAMLILEELAERGELTPSGQALLRSLDG